MKKITCILVEDEKPSMDELRFILEPYEMLEIIGEANTGKSGFELTKALHPDLVFLDISMPEGSGIELASKLMFLTKRPEIIFTTAHTQHAINAFELGAIDYLLKPYDERRLHKTMERVRELFLPSPVEAAAAANSEKCDRLPVFQGEKVVLVPIDQIDYCSADKDQTLIHTSDGVLSCNLTLSEIIQKTNLFRVHRGTLVNLRRIKEIYPWFNGTYQIVLNDSKGSSLVVSRSFVKALKQELHI